MRPNSLPDDTLPKAPLDKQLDCSWTLSLLLAIPILGELCRIVNAYTYDGDRQSDFRIAPWRCWIAKHWFSILVTGILTYISSHHDEVLNILTTSFPAWITLVKQANSPTSITPGQLILNIFPNVLGFGIGVYALIFSLSSVFVRHIQERLQPTDPNGDSKSYGSVLMLNSDLAYPLLVVAISIGVAVIQQVYLEFRFVEIAAWAALWYSLLMLLEMLTALFGLGENELLRKLKASPQDSNAIKG